MEIPKLEHGIGLVLCGPQGCGKSRLARELAAQHGAYIVQDMALVGKRFELSAAIRSKPRTIIFEGAPQTPKQHELMKTLLTQRVLKLPNDTPSGMGLRPPFLIICAQEEQLPDDFLNARRFRVVGMPVMV